MNIFTRAIDSYERFFDYENGVPRWRQIGEIAAAGAATTVVGVITGENLVTAIGATIDGAALAMGGCRSMISLGLVSDANGEANG